MARIIISGMLVGGLMLGLVGCGADSSDGAPDSAPVLGAGSGAALAALTGSGLAAAGGLGPTWEEQRQEADRLAKEQRDQAEQKRLDSVAALYPQGGPFWLSCTLTGRGDFITENGNFGVNPNLGTRTDVWKIDPDLKLLYPYDSTHQELGRAYQDRQTGPVTIATTFTPEAIEQYSMMDTGVYEINDRLRIDRRTLDEEKTSSSTKPGTKIQSTDRYAGPCEAIPPPVEPEKRF